MKQIIQKISILFISVLALTSCVKKDFDSPPDTTKIDPNLKVDTTIAGFKAKYGANTAATLITDDWTVAGIVIGDDRSGNLYKQIYVADSTGGITILIDAYSLYAHYPVGRKVYLKLKGMYFGYYSKLPQIGGAPDETGALSNLTGQAIDDHIVKANFPNAVPITHFANLAALKTANPSMFNRLVIIDDVEFSAADTAKTYAEDATLASGSSRAVEDCNGNTVILRTSAYANFQKTKLAKGKGSITALYTVFGTTPQLLIRDTSDIQFYGPRCGATPPATNDIISIDSVRNIYNLAGADVALPDVQIKGIVISDVVSKNVSVGTIIVQDGNKGVMVYMGSAVSFKMGDSVIVSLNGATITKYQGALEIKGITSAKVFVAAQGKSVTPKTITIADLIANFGNYESTLVKVENATISGGSTYGASLVVKDGSTSSSLQLYTASGATFSGNTVPTGSKTVQAIVTPYQSSSTFPLVQELKMRNASDVY